MNEVRTTRLYWVLALLLVAACGGQKSGDANASKPPSGASAPGAGLGNAAKRPIAVLTQIATLSNFVDATEALGTAKSNESVDITAKATNRVVAIHFTEGEYVKRDAVLVEFDAAEARANLAAAEATLRDTQSQYQRSRELFASKALSESDLVQLEAKMLSSKAQVAAAQARVNDTVIRAPFGGRMGLRNVSLGSLVTPGQVISTLDDTNIIKLDFTVQESYLATVHEGQQIEALSITYPGQVFRGKVGTVATRVDPVSRSAVVRALVNNADRRLKPGMFMTVRLTRMQTNKILIPEQALVPESSQQFVYVVRGDIAHKVPITIGLRQPGRVEVQQGLQAGDVVVVEGGDKLTEGAKVQPVDAKSRAA